MKNNDMTGLLNLAYEIEGLLMLHINRGDEAAPEMRQLLVDKATRLLQGLTADAAAQPLAQPVCVPVTETVAAEEQPAEQPVEQPAETAEEEAVAESAIEEETDDAVADNAPVSPTINDTLGTETQLTLDERLARERAADISKAFTLNDRFRFRRELFNNSDEEFKETLDVVASMTSMDEAEDYFFNDLCWDPAKDEVKEFMAIVAKHF